MTKFNYDEIELLLGLEVLDKELTKKLLSKNMKLSSLTTEELGFLYEGCYELLQRRGFDRKYELNEEGRKLEAIIDKINDFER